MSTSGSLKEISLEIPQPSEPACFPRYMSTFDAFRVAVNDHLTSLISEEDDKEPDLFESDEEECEVLTQNNLKHPKKKARH